MRRLVYCAALACLAALAHAQTTPAPKPPPELKQLDYLVGKWSCEWVNRLTNVKWTGARQCGWFKGGFVLECRQHITAPNELESVGIHGFSTVERAYTLYSYGSTGAMPSVSKGQRTGTTWTYTREGTSEGRPAKYESVTNEVSASRFSFQGRRAVEGGSWAVTLEGDCNKEK